MDIDSFVHAPYTPKPGLIEVARLLYERQPLPRIKAAESAGLPRTLQLLISLAERAARDRRRILVILNGVPVSGKTFLALELVHHEALKVFGPKPSVFLSGNRPLIQVLRHVIGARPLIEDIHAFLREYAPHGRGAPPERVWVFDEAQRAWDAEQVFAKHRGALPGGSEPELLVRISERVAGGFLILALRGEGQKIHTGEEGCLDVWADAARSGGWKGPGDGRGALPGRSCRSPAEPHAVAAHFPEFGAFSAGRPAPGRQARRRTPVRPGRAWVTRWPCPATWKR